MNRVFVLILTIIFLFAKISDAQQWYSLPNPAIAAYMLPVGVGGGQVDFLKTINNKLYICGGFGGSPIGIDLPFGNGVASFDGINWDSLGRGLGSGGVPQSIEYYNGEFYVGGAFKAAWSGNSWPNVDVPNTQYLAKWNGGSTFLAVTSFPPDRKILSLKYKGDLYIGGYTAFSSVAGISCKHIVCYNGSTWDNMLGGLDFGGFTEARTMIEYNGDLYVGGSFGVAGSIPCNNVARWDGTQWDSLGRGVNGSIWSMTVDTANGYLYVGGNFDTAGTTTAIKVARWDGSQWSAVGKIPSAGNVTALKYFDNQLFAASVDYTPRDSVLYKWNGTNWQVVYGPQATIVTLEVYKGNLYVGGNIDKIDTTTVNYIACYGDSCPGTPITLTLPYGVNELKNNLKFKVYPNPAQNNITVEIDMASGWPGTNNNFIVRIINLLGQQVFEHKFQKKIEIDVSTFGKGLLQVEVCEVGRKYCHAEKILIE